MSAAYDVVVVGGGPAGYVAAVQASKLGLSTAIVEKERLGGICLNWGCIPTKSLLNISKKYSGVKKFSDFGINVQKVSFDMERAVSFSRKAVDTLAQGIEFLMKKNNIAVINGFAKISEDKSIICNEKGIKAKNVVIATGARAREIDGLDVDGYLIWNARHAMVSKKVPKSLLIVGSGAIGLEFASFYNSVGTKVILIDASNRIMNTEDEEIADLLRIAFEKSGVKIYVQSKVVSVEKKIASVVVDIENPKGNFTVEVDHVLIAAGVVANSENIGLESFKSIKIEKSWIKVDGNFETSEKGIYAIGDVIGPPCLAHKASREGVLIAKHIYSGADVPKVANIPSCIYCDPQVASIGVTESDALNMGYKIKVGRSRSVSNGKSIATDEMESFVKIIFDSVSGEMLGAHVIGPDATEMIYGLVVCRELEATDDFLREIIFPHPTVSEMIFEAVLDADGSAIHA